MSAVSDLSIQTIIKKYENRQGKLLADISKSKHDNIDTARNSEQYPPPVKSGMSTPQFNYTINRKDINKNLEEINERTEKKLGIHPHQEFQSASFRHSFSQDRNDYENILRKLDQTEDKLAKAERNYAEIWRKYERLQQEKEHSGKEVQLEQRLRQHEVGEMEGRVITLEKENKNYKECILSKDSNIDILREKLREKNERLIEAERIIGELKSELISAKAERDRLKQVEDSKKKEKDDIVTRLKAQFDSLQKLSQQKQSQKKQLLQQMQKSYKSHQQQLQILKKSYLQVEQQYKEWIQQCNQQKIAIIKEYEAKLTQARSSVHDSHVLLKVQNGYEEEIGKREQEINRLVSAQAKQNSQLKHLSEELENAEKDRSSLILKISSVENELVHRIEVFQLLETAHNKLSAQLKAEESRTKEMRDKYNSVNRQFIELRNKCSAVFSSMEQSKKGSQAQASEQIRLRKQLMICREQLQKSKNNEFSLNQRLNDGIKAMKDKLIKLEEEKNETMTDLLAERLENARLKEEIKETKEYLKKQYELSIENTRKQLQNQIGSDQKRGKYLSSGKLPDRQKEQLYLQLRGLERKYQLLADQIVTVDEVMNIAAKVQRRHQNSRK